MSYGIIEYNAEGMPKCEICGDYFHRVLAHARQAHGISAKEYKAQWGYDAKKGVCSPRSRELSRNKTLMNYEKCVQRNLVLGGAKSRYQPGCTGRTVEMVSEQTRIRLRERLHNPEMRAVVVESGKRLGIGGTGNKKRWAK